MVSPRSAYSRSCWVPTSVLWKQLCHGITVKYYSRSVVVPVKADLIPPPPSWHLWSSRYPTMDSLPPPQDKHVSSIMKPKLEPGALTSRSA